jgi:hypothetical protein
MRQVAMTIGIQTSSQILLKASGERLHASKTLSQNEIQDVRSNRCRCNCQNYCQTLFDTLKIPHADFDLLNFQDRNIIFLFNVGASSSHANSSLPDDGTGLSAFLVVTSKGSSVRAFKMCYSCFADVDPAQSWCQRLSVAPSWGIRYRIRRAAP